MPSMHPARLMLTTLFAASLAACGGGGDGSGPSASATTPTTPTSPTTPNNPAPSTPAPAGNQFTKQATWQFTPQPGQTACFDFVANAEVDCAGTSWGVKFVGDQRTGSFYTNSGPSGNGKGGAFGGPDAHTWNNLLTWSNATTDPTGGAVPAAAYLADSAHGVFTADNSIQSAIFEYDLNGTHQLSPTMRTFLITSNSASADLTGAAGPVFALQVIGYYGGAGGATSGWPTIRWVNTAARGTVRTQTLNASAGWVYVNLDSGAVVGAGDAWHIAFNRYSVKLNGGASGSGTVAGFLSKTPAGLYGADGKPVAAAFNALTPASTLADLTGTQTGPATAADWIQDTVGSALNLPRDAAADSAAYATGELNYGWYSVYPGAANAAAAGVSPYQMLAHPQAATLVRSGDGASYARMHLTSIQYAPATPPYAGTQTWTVQFDVQPAP